jgi:hypothetical protein
MVMPIGLFHLASQAIRQGAEMTLPDGAALLAITCVLTGALIIWPKG